MEIKTSAPETQFAGKCIYFFAQPTAKSVPSFLDRLTHTTAAAASNVVVVVVAFYLFKIDDLLLEEGVERIAIAIHN
jgi:hypothetical protein